MKENLEKLKKIVYGFRISQCIYTAVNLGILDYLEDKTLSCTVLAQKTNCDESTLLRLLRVLVSVEILQETNENFFSLNTLGKPLTTKSVDSIKNEVLHFLNPSIWASWGELSYSVETGLPAFPKFFGKQAWEYRGEHKELSNIFINMVQSKIQKETGVILQNLDLRGIDTIIDIGGGDGSLLIQLLKHYSELKGVLFDQSHVVDANKISKNTDILKRCQIKEGSFFVDVPKNGDIYLLKHVLHNWDNDSAIHILKNCRQAILPHGKLIIIESVLDHTNANLENFIDIHMLVTHGGQERTIAEFSTLFKEAGFILKNVQKTDDSISIIEGKPI